MNSSKKNHYERSRAFHVKRNLNQNCRFYATENPQIIGEVLLDEPKMTVVTLAETLADIMEYAEKTSSLCHSRSERPLARYYLQKVM